MGAGSDSVGRESAGIRSRHRADQRYVPAVIAKTTQIEVVARRRPASAGPANIPTLATVFMTALAAVSSSGVSTSEGRSAPCAGWNAVDVIVESTASAKIGQNPLPPAARAAIEAMRALRIRSAATITRRRGSRSARRPIQGAPSAAAPQRAK